MEIFSLIVEILIIGLLILAVVTIVKYPMDIIRGFLNFIRPRAYRPSTIIFLPIWLIAWTLNKVFKLKIIEPIDSEFEDQSEESYKSTKELKFDFEGGNKFLITNAEIGKTEDAIKDFLGFSNANITFDDFSVERISVTVVKCPDNIPFYDFNLLVQYSNNELSSTESYGVFRSDRLSFYCYQDPITTHNIIGKTSSDLKFSIYTLDDLNKKVWLRLNQQINVKELNVNVKNGVHHML